MSRPGTSLSTLNKRAVEDYMANRYERAPDRPTHCVCTTLKKVRRYAGRWLCRCGRQEAV